MTKFKNINMFSKEISTETVKNHFNFNEMSYEKKIEVLELQLKKKNEIIAELEKRVKNGNFKTYNATRYDIDINTIIQLKKNGMSNVKIARQLGCSEGTIRNRILQMQSN